MSDLNRHTSRPRPPDYVHVAVFLLTYTPHLNAMNTQKINQDGDHSPDPCSSTQSVHAGEADQTVQLDNRSISPPHTFADTQSATISGEKLPREEYARYGNPSDGHPA
jgi:hypothetical protein